MQSQLCAAINRLCLSRIARPGCPFVQNITSPNVQQVLQVRNVHFFAKRPSEDLWKSITMVSSAGMRRGRGRRVNSKLITDLYKGQKFGDGKIRMIWPGLNAPALRGKEINQQEKAPVSEDSESRTADQRDKQLEKKFTGPKVHPLERGYTSRSICGRSLVGVRNMNLMEGFDYRVVAESNVSHMTGEFGRVQSAVIMVACGNGNGVIGFGRGKGPQRMSAAQLGARKASARLLYIERYKNHTVLHDFFSQYYATKLFVSKKPEGYGLRCHRVIATLCRLIGIKDIHVKVEGSTLDINIVKAFILGLVRQRKYQDMADEKQLHLVEFDKQAREYPVVLASPEVCRTSSQIPSSENLDFQQFSLGGRVVLHKPKREAFYTKLPGWQRHLLKSEYLRGRQEQRIEIIAQYGEVRSHLTDQFPECKPHK